MAEPLETLDLLSSSLDEIEILLGPLFQRSLAQTEESLEPLQRAKLDVLLTYVIQDLVLIFLKTKGLDPSKHPVSEELKRVKSYFDKIKAAENPVTRGLVVDRAAASRFIRAAISEAQASGSAVGAPAAPPAVHTRFPNFVSSTERSGSAPENNTRPEDDDSGSASSDDDLEIIDDASVSTHKSGDIPTQRVVAAPTHPTAPAKRRRAMDPFAGYSAGPSSSQTPVVNGDEDVTSNSRKRRKQRKSNARTPLYA